jgi:hypothetical protein
MVVRSGKEAMDLLSASNRVISDLVRFRTLFKGTDQTLSIVIRPFEALPLESEVRCFVFQRNLTAATQYFSDLYFPQLQGRDWKDRVHRFVFDVLSLLMWLCWRMVEMWSLS